ncbi:MAG: type IV toxin-antitoxin system AbiEi family antitoxin domain-containing protein, partial [Tetrasphaera sp.]|nr:type IV toxin-antitoxin system AbiEi family antitoxin domain-containing protein [Tetrasphaera sp.]
MSTLRPGRAEEAGLSRSGLYRAAREGRLERIARGIYLPADAPAADWDWIEV